MNLKNFFDELKRRNVIKVATAYAIAGWLIIQVAATVAPQLKFPEWVPSFITIMVLCGFPLALIFAWAFELTPDGLKKTGTVETSTDFKSSKSKKINTAIISVLSLAIVFLLVERIFFAQSKNSNDLYTEASIAVLPFVNMSDDKNNEYFSDGLSEELLNGLAKIDGMQVAGRTSSFSFKGKNEDLREIAKELNVEHVLEGSVRKDGDKIRITAQLIKADNGYHLWSETYDRELKSVFEVQEEISRMVVKELKLRILPEDELALSNLPTSNTAAYDYFLQATQKEVSRSAKDIEAAILLYKKAIEFDPEFSLAHSRLAIAYSLLNQYGNLRLEESSQLIDEHVNKALATGKDLGMAYLAQGMGYTDIPGEDSFKKAEVSYINALKYLPNNAYLRNAMMINYSNLGNREKQTENLLRAYELDPLSPPIASNVAGYYAYENKREKATEIVDKIIAKYPDYMPIIGIKLSMLADSPIGDLPAGFKLLHESLEKNPNDITLLKDMAQLCFDLDLIDVAVNYVEKLRLLYPNNLDVSGLVYQANSAKGKDQLNVDMMQTFVDRFGEVAIKGTADPTSRSYIAMKDYDKALSVIDNAFPEIKDGSIELDENSRFGLYNLVRITEIYVHILKKKGRFDDTKPYIIKLENYHNLDSTLSAPLDSLEIDQVSAKRDLSAARGDYDKMLTLTEYLYFNRKHRRYASEMFRTNVNLSYYAEEPKVLELQQRIIEDLHKMRAVVIDYLKTEEEWDEAWDAKLN